MKPAYFNTPGVTDASVIPVKFSVSAIVYVFKFKFCFLCITLYAVFVFAVHTAKSVIVSLFVVTKLTLSWLLYFLVPPFVIDHPPNVYPALVNAFAVNFFVVPYVIDKSDISPSPPFASNLILYEFAVHCAYNVILSLFVFTKLFTLFLFVYFVPVPSFFIFQLLNVYPALVNAFAVNVFAVPYVIDKSDISPLASVAFLLNFIVYLFAVHTAKSVIVPLFVVTKLTLCWLLYFLAPPFVIDHPPNVYPVLVNAFAVNFFAVPYVIDKSDISPSPPFASNLILYEFAVHCAYRFILPLFVSTKLFTLFLFVYFVPVPSFFIFQLLNVYPALVNAFAVNVFAVPYVIDKSDISPLASVAFLLNFIVYLFAVHTAKSVIVPLFVFTKLFTLAPLSYATAPPFVIDHPPNVYPALVNAFAVNFFAVPYVIDKSDIVPLASVAFLLNFIVYLFAVHLAYNIISFE